MARNNRQTEAICCPNSLKLPVQLLSWYSVDNDLLWTNRGIAFTGLWESKWIH